MRKYRKKIAIGFAVLVLSIALGAWRMNMWKSYEGAARGVMIEGDASAPPTRWWNHLYLALLGWKAVTVFKVSADDAAVGYMVGYRPFDGKAMVKDERYHDRRFRMKNGHEACRFFALAPNGSEIKLTVVARTTVDDTNHRGAPLH